MLVYIPDKIKNVLILDMDNTIADLFKVDNWLDILTNGTVNQNYQLFLNLDKLISEEDLKKFCEPFKYVVVISMVPSKQTSLHDKAVVKAKVEWLHKNFSFIHNIIITKRVDNKNLLDSSIILYDTRKNSELDFWIPSEDDTLCDDSDDLRHTFIGKTIKPQWKIRKLNE
ncbi:hypothetical protein [uncultured Methanobrevibacter sp.]|uniref:hypothetical protein n=1 Tax=uncultured Methanobrevibacter sp. TaxID=253161 RepID=UPI0025E4609B|nr:hypothetical protein [uncultured Methanobrevibacter sp.]